MPVPVLGHRCARRWTQAQPNPSSRPRCSYRTLCFHSRKPTPLSANSSTWTEAGWRAWNIAPGGAVRPHACHVDPSNPEHARAAARSSVSDTDRDEELARTADRLSATGPFKSRLFVAANLEHSALDVLATAGIDDARSTRLVVLDPRQFSLLNGIDKETRTAIRAAMGIGPNKLPVQWASSAVFAIVDTQRRRQARGAAGSYLAWEARRNGRGSRRRGTR